MLWCWVTMQRINFFRGEDPIGKEVQVYGDVFTVIGVLEKQKSAFGGGKNAEDNMCDTFPLGTFHKIHPELKDVWITVKYDDAEKQRPGCRRNRADFCASGAKYL